MSVVISLWAFTGIMFVCGFIIILTIPLMVDVIKNIIYKIKNKKQQKEIELKNHKKKENRKIRDFEEKCLGKITLQICEKSDIIGLLRCSENYICTMCGNYVYPYNFYNHKHYYCSVCKMKNVMVEKTHHNYN